MKIARLGESKEWDKASEQKSYITSNIIFLQLVAWISSSKLTMWLGTKIDNNIHLYLFS